MRRTYRCIESCWCPRIFSFYSIFFSLAITTMSAVVFLAVKLVGVLAAFFFTLQSFRRQHEQVFELQLSSCIRFNHAFMAWHSQPYDSWTRARMITIRHYGSHEKQSNEYQFRNFRQIPQCPLQGMKIWTSFWITLILEFFVLGIIGKPNKIFAMESEKSFDVCTEDLT